MRYFLKRLIQNLKMCQQLDLLLILLYLSTINLNFVSTAPNSPQHHQHYTEKSKNFTILLNKPIYTTIIRRKNPPSSNLNSNGTQISTETSNVREVESVKMSDILNHSKMEVDSEIPILEDLLGGGELLLQNKSAAAVQNNSGLMKFGDLIQFDSTASDSVPNEEFLHGGTHHHHHDQQKINFARNSKNSKNSRDTKGIDNNGGGYGVADDNNWAEERLRSVIMNRTLSRDGSEEDEFDRLLFSSIPNGSKLILKTVKLVKADKDGNIPEDYEEDQEDRANESKADPQNHNHPDHQTHDHDNEDDDEENLDQNDDFEDTKGSNWNLVVHNKPNNNNRTNDLQLLRGETNGIIRLEPGKDLEGAAGTHHNQHESGHHSNHGGSHKGGKHHQKYYHKDQKAHHNKKAHKDTEGSKAKYFKGADEAGKHHKDVAGHKEKSEGGRHKESHKKNKGRKVTGFKRVYHKEEYQRTEHFYDDEHANKISEKYGHKDQKEKAHHGQKHEGKKYHGDVKEAHDTKYGKKDYTAHGDGHKGHSGGHKDHGGHEKGKYYGHKGHHSSGQHGYGGGHGGGGGGYQASYSAPEPASPIIAPPTILIARPTLAPPAGAGQNKNYIQNHLKPIPMTYIALSSFTNPHTTLLRDKQHTQQQQQKQQHPGQGLILQQQQKQQEPLIDEKNEPRREKVLRQNPVSQSQNKNNNEMKVFHSPRERFIPSIPPSIGVSYVPHLSSAHKKMPFNMQPPITITRQQKQQQQQNKLRPPPPPPQQLSLLYKDWRKNSAPPPGELLPLTPQQQKLLQPMIPKIRGGNQQQQQQQSNKKMIMNKSSNDTEVDVDEGLRWVKVNDKDDEEEDSSGGSEDENSSEEHQMKKNIFTINNNLSNNLKSPPPQAIIKVHPMQFFNFTGRSPHQHQHVQKQNQNHQNKIPKNSIEMIPAQILESPHQGYQGHQGQGRAHNNGQSQSSNFNELLGGNIKKWTNSVPISNHDQGGVYHLNEGGGLLKESSTNSRHGPLQPPSSPNQVPPLPLPSTSSSSNNNPTKKPQKQQQQQLNNNNNIMDTASSTNFGHHHHLNNGNVGNYKRLHRWAQPRMGQIQPINQQQQQQFYHHHQQQQHHGPPPPPFLNGLMNRVQGFFGRFVYPTRRTYY